MNSTSGLPRVCKTIARMDDLHARLLAAHEADDRHALVTLYTEAADQSGHEDQEAFFLTHAYVFALEMAHPDTDALKARLVANGREE